MATATALSNKPASEAKRQNSATAPEFDRVAELAYTLWESRGCPIGSPEEDWFKAEQELASAAGSQDNR